MCPHRGFVAHDARRDRATARIEKGAQLSLCALERQILDKRRAVAAQVEFETRS